MYEPFASGGMASVHLGRMTGAAGFSRTVAIKQLHPSFAEDPATVATILDEARLASRVQHPSVVSTLDVVVEGPDILLVLEYVHGESLARLLRDAGAPPVPVATAIVAAALHGLHAAHEAVSESGEPLGIVHRDVSPQNVLVGVDGLARVLDFGIAKARGRLQTTREGQVKGKLAYMAPEQIRLGEVNRRTDVFAAGIVLWEALTGERLFAGENEGHVMSKVLEAEIAAPSTRRPEVSPELDAITLRALARAADERFATARELALAVEACGPVAPASAVGRWVQEAARASLAERAARVAAIERTGDDVRAPRAATSDEVTRTDPSVASEVTATENRALSVEPSPSRVEGPSRHRAVGVGVGAAVAAALVTVGLWSGRRADVAPVAPAAPAVTSAPAPSAPSPSSSVASPPAPAGSDARSAEPEPSARGARPLSPGAPRAPARPPAAPTSPPGPTQASTAGPFYRFE